MKEALSKARALKRKFDEKIPRHEQEWDGKVLLIDLMEEVGELANAVLVEEGAKSEKVRKAQLGDSFGDILFALMLLADYYGVDLEKEFHAATDQISERLAAGKF